jgi:SiaC family regulatory phosphoprotein
MEKMLIESTKYSPRVELSPAGFIQIQGRSIIEDPFVFYNPIMNWVQNTTLASLNVEIKLEYLNTSSSIQIYKLLALIRDTFTGKDVKISWFYEEGDEDTFELGKEFESQLNLAFGFHQFSGNMAYHIN